MMEPKAMKIIAPGMCPHCQKEIIISQNMVTPIIGWVLKKEDIEKAKSDVKKQIELSNLKDANKLEIIAWLDNPETMFGPDEIQTLLSQLIRVEKPEKDDIAEKKENETN